MDPDTSGTSEDVPACTECRKRKLRCSRELPSCQHCRRISTQCVYDTKKNKPGMKPGAVETLHRRLDGLEKLVGEQQRELESMRQVNREFASLIAHSSVLSAINKDTNESTSFVSPQTNESSLRSRKRKRSNAHSVINGTGIELLSDAFLSSVVDKYFSYVHPWIPMVHEATFRRKLVDTNARLQAEALLNAMVVAAIRHMDTQDLTFAGSDMDRIVENARTAVLLAALNKPTVENLQALVVVAYQDIGDSNSNRAWPIVGSLSRLVEYLQLSIEPADESQPLLKPLATLMPSNNWTEEEERRRVFWNVFLLDRFCSITTGWNTSLTSDDVRRRLPSDGIIWRKETSVVTPFFGIWDKNAGKIGNPIVFLPAHQLSPSQSSSEHCNTELDNVLMSTVDMSTVGAFAYCIEAIESLSRVTTYFLQQKVNFRNAKEIGSWLARFKELDVRLVHWKMFLPQKWKAPYPPARPLQGKMDPNLTLAHVVHNTSMILLHQAIAYPSPEWDWSVRLPSACSADTCQSAAAETAVIAQKYLSSIDGSLPINNQFVFCVFVSARVLLIHWRHYGTTDPLPKFLTLVNTINDIGRRWLGSNDISPTSLASKYEHALRKMYTSCIEDKNFTIDVLGYTTEIETMNEDFSTSQHESSPKASNLQTYDEFSTVDSSDALAGMQNMDDFTQLLSDQQFLDMDRIITFDDGMFTANEAFW